MTETYKTVLSNEYFDFQKKYVQIEIKANDIDVFSKIVKHLKELDEFDE